MHTYLHIMKLLFLSSNLWKRKSRKSLKPRHESSSTTSQISSKVYIIRFISVSHIFMNRRRLSVRIGWVLVDIGDCLNCSVPSLAPLCELESDAEQV